MNEYETQTNVFFKKKVDKNHLEQVRLAFKHAM